MYKHKYKHKYITYYIINTLIYFYQCQYLQKDQFYRILTFFIFHTNNGYIILFN